MKRQTAYKSGSSPANRDLCRTPKLTQGKVNFIQEEGRMADWAHAPVHKLDEEGTYIVTGATLNHQHYFSSPNRLTILQNTLFQYANKHNWKLQAWAVFSNHYHFVGVSPENPNNLSQMIKEIHAETAREVNKLDEARGRKVWYNYWDTRITYQESYLARLKYVHYNPVKHGLVDDPVDYRWCSASWFEKYASPAFRKTMNSFKIDKVNVYDDYEPVKAGE
jgi:putative transposase